MTTLSARLLEPALRDSLASWRAQYPRFGALVDDGAPSLQALRYLGLALWQDGRLGEAANVLTQAAAEAPADPAMLGELGSLLCAAGRKAEALRCLTASLALAPRQLQVWLNVGGLRVELGDADSAEQAYRAALELDPDSAEAGVGLGLLYIERRRYQDAARLLGAAVARGVTAMPVYACLGQTLYLLGDFAGAAEALEKAARACPSEARIIQKYAEARLIEKLIAGSVVEAIESYLAIAGRHAQDLIVVCGRAFQILCAYGKADAAIRLGEILQKRSPEDPIVAYHLDALHGRPRERAPDAYLAACFGAYAEDFDRHLVEVLDYRVPETMGSMLARSGRAFPRMLDLGCGTGLAAPSLAPLGGHLTGVDIAPRMLDKARERNLYGELFEGEAVAWLEGAESRFDLVTALDMVIYFGDLSALFAAVARRLAPGGVFAFSFETLACDRFALRPSGRFAHDPGYVASLLGAEFSVLDRQASILRFEANQPVLGEVLLLRRA